MKSKKRNKPEIPLLYGSPNDKAIFNPEDFLKYYEKSVKTGKIKFPKQCIVSYYSEILGIIKKNYDCKRINLGKHVVAYEFKYKNKSFISICDGIGASHSGSVLEELIAGGGGKIFCYHRNRGGSSEKSQNW